MLHTAPRPAGSHSPRTPPSWAFLPTRPRAPSPRPPRPAPPSPRPRTPSPTLRALVPPAPLSPYRPRQVQPLPGSRRRLRGQDDPRGRETGSTLVSELGPEVSAEPGAQGCPWDAADLAGLAARGACLSGVSSP